MKTALVVKDCCFGSAGFDRDWLLVSNIIVQVQGSTACLIVTDTDINMHQGR